MESLGHEVVPFEDVVCQMWDMLKLGARTYVTLQVGPDATSASAIFNFKEHCLRTSYSQFRGQSSDSGVVIRNVSVAGFTLRV